MCLSRPRLGIEHRGSSVLPLLAQDHTTRSQGFEVGLVECLGSAPQGGGQG